MSIGLSEWSGNREGEEELALISPGFENGLSQMRGPGASGKSTLVKCIRKAMADRRDQPETFGGKEKAEVYGEIQPRQFQKVARLHDSDNNIIPTESISRKMPARGGGCLACSPWSAMVCYGDTFTLSRATKLSMPIASVSDWSKPEPEPEPEPEPADMVSSSSDGRKASEWMTLLPCR